MPKRADEQRKLTATFLNTLAGASITVGVIAPMAAAIIAYPLPPFDFRNLVVGIALWLLAGLGLHSAGRYVLRGLPDDKD